MRILKDIYDDLDVSSNFALLAFQPSSFEEAIKDENWVQAMDEEMNSMACTLLHRHLISNIAQRQC